MAGTAAERELVNWLREAGFAAMRSPASGSATDDDLPDVIADDAANDRHWVIELKERRGYHAYIGAEEVAALKRYAERSGHRVLLGGRFKQDHDTDWNRFNDAGWDINSYYLLDAEQAYLTDDGSARLSRPDRLLPDADDATGWPGPVVLDGTVQ